MTLTELVPPLRTYRAVLVTGPQRSGTAIGAKVLAQELMYREIPEEKIQVHDVYRAAELMRPGAVVVHGPGLCHVAHLFPSDIAIVVMRRNLADIHASEQRIGWRTAYDGKNLEAERRKYLFMFGRNDEDIAALKYEIWDKLQKKECSGFDLDYSSLEQHPLWVTQRETFAPRQTEAV
jgi:hypothetical protein